MAIGQRLAISLAKKEDKHLQWKNQGSCQRSARLKKLPRTLTSSSRSTSTRRTGLTMDGGAIANIVRKFRCPKNKNNALTNSSHAPSLETRSDGTWYKKKNIYIYNYISCEEKSRMRHGRCRTVGCKTFLDPNKNEKRWWRGTVGCIRSHVRNIINIFSFLVSQDFFKASCEPQKY